MANLHLRPKEESSQFQAGPFLEQFVGPRLPPFLVAAEMTEVWTFLASCLPTPLNFCQKRENAKQHRADFQVVFSFHILILLFPTIYFHDRKIRDEVGCQIRLCQKRKALSHISPEAFVHPPASSPRIDILEFCLSTPAPLQKNQKD